MDRDAKYSAAFRGFLATIGIVIIGLSPQSPTVKMDCHSVSEGYSPSQPDCCGDSCPDMTACAALHAAGPSDCPQVLPQGRSVPVDRYAVALITALMRSGATQRSTTTIPNHPGDMPEGTVRAVLKQAGIEPEVFLQGK